MFIYVHGVRAYAMIISCFNRQISMRYEVIGRVRHVRDSTGLFSISPIEVRIAGSVLKSFVGRLIHIQVSGFLSCFSQTHIRIHMQTHTRFSSICK